MMLKIMYLFNIVVNLYIGYTEKNSGNICAAIGFFCAFLRQLEVERLENKLKENE